MLLALVACGATPGPDAAPFACEAYALPARLIEVAQPALVEVSGLASSRRNPGVLWAHNDSGDAARVFALGEDGATLGELALPVPLVDAEDLAIAPCLTADSGPCLWIADVGNNDRDRTDLGLVMVPEPVVGPDAPLGQATAPAARRIPVRYPSGVVIDSEALVIADGVAYVFEKVDGPIARIFGGPLPADADGEIVMAEIARLSSPGIAIARGRMITGAALHPLGTRVALRVYTGIYEYRLEPGASIPMLGQAERIEVTVGPLSEPQGEALGYDARSGALWTMSEDPEQRAPQPLHRFGCKP
ncbi:MAG: hypothetical protein SFX73_15095 [Kofleriaceae bacterium]|nr:hypothetical protein [Kofleriaceae bacterium]